MVHALPSSHACWPLHCPNLQVSPVVQALPSSQGVLSAAVAQKLGQSEGQVMLVSPGSHCLLPQKLPPPLQSDGQVCWDSPLLHM